MTTIKEVLEEQIKVIKPEGDILDKINDVSCDFITELNKKLKSKKILAEIFIGGSIAKNTLVKKDKYDVDIFVRFDKKYGDKISDILGKLIGESARRVHGSRDYYQIINKGIILEVIPVIKIKNPKEATNVTDLSYFHVKYVLDKIKKNKKLPEEIIIAKAFCHAQDTYGAESYINGFSGYALELLICHFGSFLNFIKTIASSNDRIIIDDSKFYKKKEDILREVNEAKIQNPIILIDPTFKERNALASLSYETFLKFKSVCSEFLKNPSGEYFVRKNVFLELDKRYGKELNIISVITNKQVGDISGTKSKKFFGYFLRETKKEFVVKVSEFDYDDKKNIAYTYLVLNKKDPEIIKGPPAYNKKAFLGFKKAHPSSYIENGFSFAKVSHEMSFDKFIKMFLIKNKKIIKDMSIKEVKLVR